MKTSAFPHALVAALLSILALACSAAESEKPAAPTVEARGNTEYGAIEYVQTNQRAGVRQGFLLFRARSPVGSVILFSGGDGVLNLQKKGNTLKTHGNFLMRVRLDFVAAGYNVAAVDAPSDRRDLRAFRTSAAHAIDIKGVINYLRSQSKGPLWLVGTSNGTVSVANVATRLSQDGPDGVVLTSTITSGSGANGSVYNSDLKSIRVPVLIVSHNADLCPASSMAGSQVLAERMKATTVEEFKSFSGGSEPESGPCEPFSPHGYFGIETQVTTAIIGWMKAHSPSRAAGASGAPAER